MSKLYIHEFISELVTLARSQEVCEMVIAYKLDYATRNPLLEIPKTDSSQVS